MKESCFTIEYNSFIFIKIHERKQPLLFLTIYKKKRVRTKNHKKREKNVTDAGFSLSHQINIYSLDKYMSNEVSLSFTMSLSRTTSNSATWMEERRNL